MNMINDNHVGFNIAPSRYEDRGSPVSRGQVSTTNLIVLASGSMLGRILLSLPCEVVYIFLAWDKHYILCFRSYGLCRLMVKILQ